MARHKFNPGDEVRILPEWWDILASAKYAECNLYVQRGKDCVYIVDCYDSNDKVYLTNREGWWDENKLVPAIQVEESEISIDGLI